MHNTVNRLFRTTLWRLGKKEPKLSESRGDNRVTLHHPKKKGARCPSVRKNGSWTNPGIWVASAASPTQIYAPLRGATGRRSNERIMRRTRNFTLRTLKEARERVSFDGPTASRACLWVTPAPRERQTSHKREFSSRSNGACTPREHIAAIWDAVERLLYPRFGSGHEGAARRVTIDQRSCFSRGDAQEQWSWWNNDVRLMTRK